MTAYAERLKTEIARWTADGLIDAATADALTHDVDIRARSGINFGLIFSMMAAALLGAAILLFIAANWEDIPRLLRVTMLCVVIVGGYLGGAALKASGASAFAEAAWVIAATAFGASIALIGQMYHLSGDEKSAILIWLGGTALGAVALRSSPLTIGAALLSGVWMSLHGSEAARLASLPHAWLLIAAALWLASFWTGSIAARHLLALLVALYAWFGFAVHETSAVPALLMTGAAILFALQHFRPRGMARLGLGRGIYLHGFLYFLSAMAMLHVLLDGKDAFLLAVVLTFGGIAVALMVAGRQSTPLRWLAYTAFVVELCYVYLVMLGTMLGTAGFFLLAGLILAALAWMVRRVEARFSGPAQPAGGVS